MFANVAVESDQYFDGDDVGRVVPPSELDDNRSVVDAATMATLTCLWIRLCDRRVLLFRRRRRRGWHRMYWHLSQAYAAIHQVSKSAFRQLAVWMQCGQHAPHPRRQSFCARDLDLWPFDPKINGFPRLMVEYFCVEFGDLSCIGFWDIVRINRQTDRQTNAAENRTFATTVGVGNKEISVGRNPLRDVEMTINRARFASSSRTASTDYCLDRFFWTTRFLFIFFPYFFVSVSCARLSWPSRQLLSALWSTYRIVSYYACLL